MKTLLLLILTAIPLPVSAQTVVADAESGNPLGSVLVFNKDGSFIDMTDAAGHLPEEALRLDTVILQDIAHKSLVASLPADTLRMSPVSYTLDEVKVSQKADYLKLRCFYREYSLANDTMMRYEDGMADYYLPIHGGRVREIKLKSRQGVPGETPLCYYDWEEFMSERPEAKTTMAMIREQKARWKRDTVSFIHTDTVNGTTTAYLDMLAFDKNHSFTLGFIVFRVQITDDEVHAVYRYDPRYESQSQLMSFCNHTRVNVSGRVVRKANKKGEQPFTKIREDDFRELYVVDREVVSKEQMKEVIGLVKKGSLDALGEYVKGVDMEIPDFVPMLSDKLLDKLETLKSLTRSQWEGKDITIPTRNSK